MLNINVENAEVIRFPRPSKNKDITRKTGLNRNKEGSVRKINGKIYVDFYYLDERVRESSGLSYNRENVRQVRDLLDKIIVSIKSGEFRYAEVFPNSKKAEYFTEKEFKVFGGNRSPEQVLFKDYVWTWYELLKDSERVSLRTLWGYKSYINNYLIPYFGKLKFADMNKSTFDKFVSWSKKQEYRGKTISNSTVNKIFVPLKMICKDASIEYGWGSAYNPFFGFKKPPKKDSYESLSPFSLEEQNAIITSLPDHWKPYFLFAFSVGLRQGEQIGIKPGDINWDDKTLKISRAITRDENGKFIMGNTKNRHSRRTINLIPAMLEALEMQDTIYKQFRKEYFFVAQRV